MTLQDYINLSLDSIRAFFNAAGPVLLAVIMALLTLLVGIIVGTILKRILEEILKAVNFEKTASGWNVYNSMVKSHDGVNATEFFGELLRWVTVLVFLLPAIAALDVAGAQGALSNMIGYLPNLVLAGFVLMIGFVFAWFLHRAAVAVGAMVQAPNSHLVANVVYIAVVTFAIIESLVVLRVPSDVIKNGVLLTLAAVALAAALGGKDTIAALVKRLFDATK